MDPVILILAKKYADLKSIYIDEATEGEHAGVKYRLVMIDGEPFMEVIEVPGGEEE